MLRFFFAIAQDRSFPSYDNCPEIYYRFNGGQEYGPQNLDRFVSFFAARSNEMIEGRFADENRWRALSYFLDLWGSIPPSAHTIQRLKRAGLNPEGITESVGRKLLRDKQDSKPPTPRQIEYLRIAGLETPEGLDRKEARRFIRDRERALADEQQRLAKAPEIEAFIQRLKELTSQVRELVPDWKPLEFEDPVSYTCYIDVVESALEHATGYDLVELQNEPFWDGLDIDSSYYLEFRRDPTAEEIRRFQAALFRAYLEARSEKFDHLVVLRRTLPMARASLM